MRTKAALLEHIHVPRPRTRRRVQFGLAVSVLTIYLYVIALPRSEHASFMRARLDTMSIQRDELAERRRRDAVEPRSQRPSESHSHSHALGATEFLPTVSALGAQNGVMISTAKQVSNDRQSGESRVHLRATADFGSIVALLDELGSMSVNIALDNLVIRRRATGTERTELDVEAVLVFRSPLPLTEEGSE